MNFNVCKNVSTLQQINWDVKAQEATQVSKADLSEKQEALVKVFQMLRV